MVKETRIIFDTGDIRAIRIRCNVRKGDKVCGGETLYLPRKHDRPGQCAVCGTEWWVSNQNYTQVLRLLEAVQALQGAEHECPVTAYFEIDDEEEG